MIPHKWIVAAVRNHFTTNVTLLSSTSVESTGYRVDPRGLDKWARIEVLNAKRKPKRTGDFERSVLRVNFSVWVKPTSNLYDHQKIAAQIAESFDNACVAILDRSASGMPELGKIRFSEPSTRNMTPAGEDRLRTSTRHIVVSVSATAQEN